MKIHPTLSLVLLLAAGACNAPKETMESTEPMSQAAPEPMAAEKPMAAETSMAAEEPMAAKSMAMPAAAPEIRYYEIADT